MRTRVSPGSVVGGSVAEATLAEAEARIGPFPPDYRDFVRRFGWLNSPTVKIFGLGAASGSTRICV